MLAQISVNCTRPLIVPKEEAKENKARGVFYILRTHHTIREITGLVGTVQDIKERIEENGKLFTSQAETAINEYRRKSQKVFAENNKRGCFHTLSRNKIRT